MGLPEHLVKDVKSKMYQGTDALWHTDFLETGVPNVDYALGGGFGYGRLHEIFGNWSSGKTMLLYYALAENQKRTSKTGRKGISLLAEAEGAYDPNFFKLIGGNPEELVVWPIDTVEQFFDDTHALVDAMIKVQDDTPFCIGWDGIAATGTKHLQEVGLATRDMTKAFLMDQGAKLILTAVKKARVCIIATNQTREKIGDNDSATHTPGGKGWPFAASQRVELNFDGGTKTSTIYHDDQTTKIGRWVRGEVVKNKLAIPFGRFSLSMYLKHGFEHPVFNDRTTKLGIDKEQALFSLFRKEDVRGIRVILEPSKSWFVLNEAIPNHLGGGTKFRKSDWPKVLDDSSWLWRFSYRDFNPKQYE
jgi:RecA/RadA recombinase